MWEASTSNPKHFLKPIAHKYREGKLKSTRNRELKDLKPNGNSMMLLFGVASYVSNNGPGSVCEWQE